MKKRLVALLMALCLVLVLVPAALATDTVDLQARIDNAASGSTITLGEDATLSAPLVITKQLTLDGAGKTLTAGSNQSAIRVETNEKVIIKNFTIEGSIGVDLLNSAANVEIVDSILNVTSRGIRFLSEGTTPTFFRNASLTLNHTTIQNTLKPSGNTYENWSHQGDSRGISVWNVKSSSINVINGSQILGFGYPINMSGDANTGGRDMENSTITITDSNLWGWCALNIWTIDAAFNITDSSLKGFVETNNEWNSFATIVLNDGIYGNITSAEKANVFTISGGEVSSNCVPLSDDVFHILFRLDKEFMSEFHFTSSETSFNRVNLNCSQPYSAFVATYSGMTEEAFTAWAATHISGSNDVTYNWGLLAPGIEVDTMADVAAAAYSVPSTFANESCSGGQGQ